MKTPQLLLASFILANAFASCSNQNSVLPVQEAQQKQSATEVERIQFSSKNT